MSSSLKRRIEALSRGLQHKGRKRKDDCVRPPKERKSDPSAAYDPPTCAPIVTAWTRFFAGREARVFVGARRGYRTVAKLCARRQDGKRCVVGLFAPRTHRVLEDTATSDAQSDVLNRAIRVVIAAIDEHDVLGYGNGEAAGAGSLNYVCLMEERASRTVSVALVANAADDRAVGLTGVAARLGEHRAIVHSVHALYRPADPHDNSILGRGDGRWAQLYPAAEVRGTTWPSSGLVEDRLFAGGPTLYYAPPCFRQANLDQFRAIVSRIQKAVPRGASVLELYAGVGLIGAHLDAAVRASDENPWNKACVERAGMAGLYETAPAAIVAARGDMSNADVVVVDPPRRGLCDAVRDALLAPPRARPNLLVYVSCGFDAFQRDCTRLLETAWSLDHVEGHLLFPGADHIETLAIFSRRQRRGTAAAAAAAAPPTKRKRRRACSVLPD